MKRQYSKGYKKSTLGSAVIVEVILLSLAGVLELRFVNQVFQVGQGAPIKFGHIVIILLSLFAGDMISHREQKSKSGLVKVL